MPQRPARQAVPVDQTWDLESLYPTEQAWEADLARVDQQLDALSAYQGRLHNPDTLAACLHDYETLQERETHVFQYAFNKWSVDAGNPDCLCLRDQALALRGRLEAATAFLKPELLTLPPDALTPESPYRQFLLDILAEQAHMLSTEGEQVLAGTAELGATFYGIYQSITSADMQFDPVTDEQGEQVPMSMGALSRLLQSPHRPTRQAAYESAARAYLAHRQAITATMAAAQQRDWIIARLRRYPSSLAAALAEAHLPEALFHNLLATTEAGAHQLRRYANFRRQALDLAELQPWDLTAPLDHAVATDISFADAGALLRQALAPLGPEYAEVLDQALTQRWIDWADNAGKQAGAYSCHWHGYHPVILMTWHGTISDLFTLAHELGHAVHSVLSSRHQSFLFSNCSLFLAEIPSTANELLLAHHLLQQSTDRPLRRYVLTRAIEAFLGNFWSASIGAAVQLAMHRAIEQNQGLTYESITATQMAMYRRWYGDTLTITADGVGSQWLRVPHHFMNYYYYQYATGISAAAAFTRAILTEGAPAVQRYLTFLQAGSSAHPLDLLQAAGIDMTTAAPIEQAIAHFADLVTQLEQT